MNSIDLRQWYEASLMQVAAESYRNGANSEPLIQTLTRGNAPVEDGQSGGYSRMALVQARWFTDHFTIHQLPNTASGFSGTVIIDNRGTSPSYTLAFRSTEYRDASQGGDFARDVLGADMDISRYGFAFAQLADMEAWYQSLRAPGGLLHGVGKINVSGYSLGGHLATVFTELHAQDVSQTTLFNAPGRGSIDGGKTVRELLDTYLAVRANPAAHAPPPTASPGEGESGVPLSMIWTSAVQAQARPLPQSGLDPLENVHDDPRHLYAARYVAQLFQTHMIGAPGRTASAEHPERGLENGADALITHLYGHATHDDAEMVANSGVRTPQSVALFIEDQPDIEGWVGKLPILPSLTGMLKGDFGNTHSLVLLIDSLAVMDALDALQGETGRLDHVQLGNILAAASNERARPIAPLDVEKVAESDSLEAVLDSLRRLFLGATDKTLANSRAGGFGDIDRRNDFHERLEEVRQSPLYRAAQGKLRLQTLEGIGADAMLAEALRDDEVGLAWRHALSTGSAFVVLGDAAAVQARNQHGALDLYDEATGEGSLTREYLAERAAYIERKLYYNLRNARYNTEDGMAPAGDSDATAYDYQDVVWTDRAVDQPLQRGGITASTVYVGFGDNRAGALEGGRRDDSLFGGASTDYLLGGGGSDLLEGGAGMDVYEFSAQALQNSEDVVRDADRRAVLTWVPATAGESGRGLIVDASVQLSATQWESADQRFTYSLDQRDLLVSARGEQAGRIRLRDFKNGDFGIFLRTSRGLPLTQRLLEGDREPKDVDPANVGVQQGRDALGNVSVSDQAAPDRVDVLFGGRPDSASPSHANTPGDRIIAGGGDDLILSDRPEGNPDNGMGDDDWISGGAGRDLIAAGAGDDLVEAGEGDDVVDAGAGHDALYANDRLEIAQALRNPTQSAGNGGRGDLLFAGAGDDSVFGGADADALFGGAGNDLLIGGGGDDNLQGDRALQLDTREWSVTREVLLEDKRYVTRYEGVTFLDEGLTGDADILYGGDGQDWISGNGGNDVLDGGNGDDVLFGGEGDDALSAGAGNDVLDGDQGDDYLDGGDGDDEVYGSEGNDVLVGGAGRDFLAGGAGRDIYLFRRGDGEDTIHDTTGKSEDASVIVVAEGIGRSSTRFRRGSLMIDFGRADPDDPQSRDAIHLEGWNALRPRDTPVLGALQFASGELMRYEDILAQGFDIEGSDEDDDGRGQQPALLGTGVTDRISGYGGDDVLIGHDGDDRLEGGSGDDLLDGGAGGDQLDGGHGNDLLHGGAGDDLLEAGEGADLLAGGTGADRLDGGRGADRLFGHAGDDTLQGGDGDDLLDAGEGSDLLVGGRGDDILRDSAGGGVFRFELGDGNDLLLPGSGEQRIRFGAGIALSSLSVSPSAAQPGSHLVRYSESDSLILAPGVQRAALHYDFADGSTHTHAALLARPAQARAAVWSWVGSEAADSLWAPQGAAMHHGLGGDDWISGSGASDKLYGDDGNDRLNGFDGNDVLRGGAGNDYLSGAAGADTLEGGTGNDTLAGDGGGDVYLFRRGDGIDVISDYGDGGHEDANVLYLPDLLPGDVAFSRKANGALEIRIHDGKDAVLVTDWFLDPARQLQEIRFADGSTVDGASLAGLSQEIIRSPSGGATLTGTIFNDRMQGGVGDDLLDGGFGDDSMDGGGGADTWVLRRGMGLDELNAASLEAGATQILQLGPHLDRSDIVARVDGDDVVLRFTESRDGVLLKGAAWRTGDWILADAQGRRTSVSSLLAEADVLQWQEAPTLSRLREQWEHGARLRDMQAVLESGRDSLLRGDQVSTEQTGPASVIRVFTAPQGMTWSSSMGYDSAFTSSDAVVIERVTPTSQDEAPVTQTAIRYLQLQPGVLRQIDDQGRLQLVDYRHVDSSGEPLHTTFERSGQEFGINAAVPVTVWNLPGSNFPVSGDASPFRFMEPGGQALDTTVAVRQEDQYQQTLSVFEHLTAGPSSNAIMVWGAGSVDAGAGDDVISARGSNPFGQFLFGGEGDDVVVGSYAQDMLVASNGSDFLFGDEGNDLFHLPFDLQGSVLIDEVSEALMLPDWTGMGLMVNAGGRYSVDTVEFGSGIKPERLAVRLEQVDNPLDVEFDRESWAWNASPVIWQALAFSWAPGVQARVLLADPQAAHYSAPRENDGFGIEFFRFADGTRLNADQMLAHAAVQNENAQSIWRGDGQRMLALNAGLRELRFGPGIQADQVQAAQQGEDLALSLTEGEDRWILPGWFTFAPQPDHLRMRFFNGDLTSAGRLLGRPPALLGSDGDDVLHGDDTGMVLHGGAGDDQLHGGSGDDVYRFNLGDGVDRILDAGGNNVLQFGPGITPDALSLGLGSLLLRVGQHGDALHIEGFDPAHAQDFSRIAGFRFDDGSLLSWSQLLERGFDLVGTVGPDSMTGTSAIDRMDGGGGNDLLNAGAGDDRYFLRSGSGLDRITDRDGSNVLVLGEGIQPAQLQATREGRDLRIGLRDTADAVLLDGWYAEAAGTNSVVESLRFADGGRLTRGDIDALVNQPPAPVGDLLTIGEDALHVPIPALRLLDNDTDPNPADVLQLVAVSRSEAGFDLRLQDGWIHYDAGTGWQHLAAGQIGQDRFRYTVLDGHGGERDAEVVLHVLGANDAPQALAPLPDLAAAGGKPFSFVLPAQAFADPDQGDTLSGSLSLDGGAPLPSWLQFDAARGVMSGTAPAMSAEISLQYTVRDRPAGDALSGLSASGSFRFSVMAPPVVPGADNPPLPPCGFDSPRHEPVAPGLALGRHQHESDGFPGRGKGHGSRGADGKLARSSSRPPAQVPDRQAESDAHGDDDADVPVQQDLVRRAWQAVDKAMSDGRNRRRRSHGQEPDDGMDGAAFKPGGFGFAAASHAREPLGLSLAHESRALSVFRGLRHGLDRLTS